MSPCPARLVPALLGLLLTSVGCRSTPKAETDTSGLTNSPTEDADNDGYSAENDCDDSDPAIHPGVAELCNGIDDNCNGVVDEGVTSVWFEDADGDGFGNPVASVEACEPTGTEVSNADDCDDGDDAVYPGAPEVCDELDNDCDGAVDEDGRSLWYADSDGDGYGDPESELEACAPEEGWVTDDTDCDDSEAAVNPGATEVCNEVDDDCDLETDEGVTTTFFVDTDGDGWGDPSATTDGCSLPGGYAELPGDCDDGNGDVNPDATEVCNGIDDDCDGDTDDDDSSLDGSTGLTTWADDDGDGFGDTDGLSAASCTVPSGRVDNSDDCDDSNFDVNPDATEVCNELDDDCDGDIDDDDSDVDVSTGVTTWADTDGDGFGDPDSTLAWSCEISSGRVDDDSDCDDSDADVNPDAAEVCNGVDDDCNGDVDGDDSGVDLTTGVTTWADGDGDGYGDPTSTSSWTCEVASGRSEDNTDCDDTDFDVNPGATEVCNDIDDDCDGDIDDDDSSLDASTTTTWYADSDGDGFGDAATSVSSCDAPSGYGSDDTDCDDGDELVSPDGFELYDGLDNDCDGDIDDDLYKGSGSDGALSVTATTDLSTDASGSRTVADAAAWSVTAISGADLTLDSTVTGLSAGDEVLLINLQGSDSAHSSVGVYELASVDSVSGSTVTLLRAVSQTYGETSNSDLTDQVIVLQRVPHYTDVTVAAGAVLTSSAWDGTSGGVLAFRATGTVSVAATGAIVADELGYAGGETGTFTNCDSFQGESYAGLGDGDGDGFCSAYNESYGHWAANYGGGGAHITGAGGEHGGGATDGESWTGGSATPPYAGSTYGTSDLTELFFGSGGGGVWNGGTDTTGEDPGPGGDGGGILIIGADTLTTAGSEAITSYGGTTFHWASGTWTYGAGGGAGGTIWLQVDTLSLAADSVDATGGFGEDTHIRAGGDGGEGRVRIDCVTCNGYSQGSSAADSELDSAAEPDPGYSEVPG